MKNLFLFLILSLWPMTFLLAQESHIQKPPRLLDEWDGTYPFCPHQGDVDLSFLLEITDEQINNIEYQTLYNWAEYVDENIWQYHIHQGQVFKGIYTHFNVKHPDKFGPGSDSALWTGVYLASMTYRFLYKKESIDIKRILKLLRGLHILTHISGVDGVMARCAIETSKKDRFRKRAHNKYTYISSSAIPDILYPNKFYPQMEFYTKITRDQFSGVLFGLAVCWSHLIGLEKDKETYTDLPTNIQQDIQKAKSIISTITKSLYKRLVKKRFKLKDHLNKVGTSSRKISGYLKLAFLALYRHVLWTDLLEAKKSDKIVDLKNEKHFEKIRKQYRRQFKYIFIKGRFKDPLDPLNNISQYYAWNLRFMRMYSIYRLETNQSRKIKAFEKIRDHLWDDSLFFAGQSVKHHKNTFFSFLYFDVMMDMWNRHKELSKINLEESKKSDNPYLQKHRFDQALWSLKSLSITPLRSYGSPLAGKKFKKRTWIAPHLRKPTQHSIWQKPPWNNVGIKGRQKGDREATFSGYTICFWLGSLKFNKWLSDH